MNFLEQDWCGLTWTPWVPMSDAALRKTLPNGPGLYRVKPSGDNSLVYIGQTGRTVRQRIRELREYAKHPARMPFNDPHTAAPSLWAWHDATGMEFECSGTAASGEPIESKRWREGCEAYLLWQYRCDFGKSTLCNHGRFHPHYFKSSNKKEDRRGGVLLNGELNPAGGPSTPPLRFVPGSTKPEWMGLNWSEAVPLTQAGCRGLPTTPGLYRVLDCDHTRVVYIGEALNLRLRFRAHKMLAVPGRALVISYVMLAIGTPAYQRHELENDLIGGFFAEHRTVPEYQFLV